MTSLKVRQELVFFKELEQLGKVSERESEFLFLMMDTDGDGLLHTERELKVRREKKNRGSMYDVWVVFSDSTPTWCFSAERVIEKKASQGVQLRIKLGNRACMLTRGKINDKYVKCSLKRKSKQPLFYARLLKLER